MTTKFWPGLASFQAVAAMIQHLRLSSQGQIHHQVIPFSIFEMV